MPLTRTLQSLLNSELDAGINTELQDTVSAIRDYMEPWFGAVVPENREEFIALCKAIILNRIEYFEHLSNSEKVSYINAQTSYKQQVNDNQARMNRASPPEEGSEAHVISEQAMLREMQERFIAEIGATAIPEILSTIDFRPTIIDFATSAVGYRPPVLNYTPPDTHSQSRHILFAPERPRRNEPLNFGNWTRTRDTWEQGYDESPYDRTTHLNRTRTYTNNNTQYIDSIAINGYTDGQYSVFMSSNWDSSVIQRFKEALHHNRIHPTTSGVSVFPNTTPILIIRVTTESINDVLDKVFSVMDSLEGENTINEAMKAEIVQSLQQFISPTPRI